MENAEIANVLKEIADLLELQEGNAFRVRSYRSAARTVRDSSRRMADLVEEGEDLSALPNIGASTAEKIREMVKRGTCKRVEQLRNKAPTELTELLHIPGLGAKKVKLLHDELGVTNAAELKEAAEKQQVRALPDMGAKTEARILEGIANQARYTGRIRLQEADEYAAAIGRHLDEIKSVQQWQIAGSFRRRKETIGDLDVLIRASKRQTAADAITEHESVAEVISKGKDKVRVRLRNGLAVDFLFFNQEAFGSALLYFTGSKAHNIALRKRARKRHWKLSEHGLFSGRKRIAGASEKEVYGKLKMPLIPPELREDRGEVEAAEDDALPKLIEAGDLRGDLHCHTTATDGKESIKAMAEAAKAHGHDYLAITDHSRAVRVVNGLTADRLRRQADKVRKINDEMKGFDLLAGIEVDILKDGRLDLPEKVLADLDWVNASVHSYFNLTRKQMTERLVTAIRSGVVNCVAHPLGRRIGERESVNLDFDAVLEACADSGVCLEINANPARLDLPDNYCQRAKQAGVKIVISTDAHKSGDLAFLSYGVGVARRGWLEKKDILNTVTAKTLRKQAS